LSALPTNRNADKIPAYWSHKPKKKTTSQVNAILRYYKRKQYIMLGCVKTLIFVSSFFGSIPTFILDRCQMQRIIVLTLVGNNNEKRLCMRSEYSLWLRIPQLLDSLLGTLND
jgi:hypothetical protein